MNNPGLLGVIALFFVCYMGQDLGDAKLGNRTEPYKAVPMCIEPDNTTYKPCQQ